MKKFKLSSYSIIYILLIVMAIWTHFLPVASETTIGIIPAKLSSVFMAPFYGFRNSIDISIFVLVLGGFLKVIEKTDVLNISIRRIIFRLKGKEIYIIPILMIILSIGGTTYGMSEETISFYVLICSVMILSGFDKMVGFTTIFLGAGIGVLGSTINPFAVGIGIDTLNKIGINVDNNLVILIGVTLWITSLLISIIYVMNYAKRIYNKPEEIEYINTDKLNKRQKLTLYLFILSFVVMIMSLITWKQYGITLFEGWTSYLTGVSFGDWYFGEISMWFLLTTIIIGVINKFSEKEIIDCIIKGSGEMLGVVYIIALSRGLGYLMGVTLLDKYILNILFNSLQNVSQFIFAPLSHIFYLALSFIIPSSSALAVISLPITGRLTVALGYSIEVMLMIFTAASGLINLITPTSGVLMGGLELANIEYIEYIKWVSKLIFILFISNIIILTMFMLFI